jgi:hypothetical protein
MKQCMIFGGAHLAALRRFVMRANAGKSWRL